MPRRRDPRSIDETPSTIRWCDRSRTAIDRNLVRMRLRDPAATATDSARRLVILGDDATRMEELEQLERRADRMEALLREHQEELVATQRLLRSVQSRESVQERKRRGAVMRTLQAPGNRDRFLAALADLVALEAEGLQAPAPWKVLADARDVLACSSWEQVRRVVEGQHPAEAEETAHAAKEAPLAAIPAGGS